MNSNVHAPSDKMVRAAEANRRYARMAISWFAVDPVQVERMLRAVQDRLGKGEIVDFLDALAAAKILTKHQIERLRQEDPPAGRADDEGSGRRPTKLEPVNGQQPGDPAQMGPYRILRRLGEGGMGAVYLAFDSKANRQVAVKVLSAEQAPKQNVLQRFQREGRNGAMLNHPNIVQTIATGQDPESNLHFIVLEFVDGLSAHDLLERAGKLQVGDALHVILDIARALEHAHKNQIIHRDIKPANILLASSGLAKLSDLGLAKRRDDPASITSASQGIGTPYYMPYEQAMNAKMADERSDIYALGATLYHLLTGEVPFPGQSSLEVVEKKGAGVFRPASDYNLEIPITLEEILARMLARDPGDRYQTVSEVIVDIERSQLSSAIPSFVQLDSALQDPIVVERLTSPVETTQPDMRLKQALEEKQASEKQIWFLRYRDQRGNLCKTKGAAADVILRLNKGTIPVNAEAARTAQGKFKPLASWPEFQAAIAALPARKDENSAKENKQAPPTPAPKHWWWIAAGAISAALIGILLTAAFLFAWAS